MGRKTQASVRMARQWLAPLTSRISLTPVEPVVAQGRNSIEVALADLITYSKNGNHTRLKLKGGLILDVKETTDQIDRLAREASSRT